MFPKNKVFCLLLISMITALFGYSELKSQNCPQGASTVSINVTVDSCQYNIVICYECLPGLGPSYYSILSFSKVDQLCTNDVTFDAAQEEIEYQLNYTGWIVALCSEIPPCTVGMEEFSVRRYRCWKYYNTAGGDLHYIACDLDYYCEKDWQVCQTSTTLQSIELSPWEAEGGTPDCQEVEPIIPPLGSYSNCWLRYDDCEEMGTE